MKTNKVKAEIPVVALLIIMALMVSLIFMAILGAQKNAAARRQMKPCVVHAAEECANHKEAAVLMVRYNEVDEGHAYCVYREQGQLYAWDYRGPMALDTPDFADDAESVALWLTEIDPPLQGGLTLKSAAYEWRSKSY